MGKGTWKARRILAYLYLEVFCLSQVLTMFFAFNAEASDPPKADGKKAERSAVPERITRPKPSPDSLPQQVEKNSNPNACPKFEYKDKPAKIVCLEKATGNDKPKPPAK
jgi:hypothetical protein